MLQGFRKDRVAAHRALEQRFDAELDRGNLRAWMQRMTARPHHVGSPFGREVAEFIAGQFRSWGYDTRIEEIQTLFPTPKIRLVELTAPRRFRARLAEPRLAQDRTSGQTREQLPVYVAYSVDGDVTGELVYVNYGVPKDYEKLERRGIDVKGKIVIARYGGSWRGIKPKVAAEKGAIGCLIYSDPRDDGYFQGDVYPKGAYRNSDGAQRGSVMDLPLMPGDPLTPGVGSTKGARRIPLAEAKTLTRIPVLPLSYDDATPLLAALGGPVVPEAWRGALPVTYRMGPGPARARLKVAFDWKQTSAYNVIATLAGCDQPDQWVIRGNHHDAWVNGAWDPVSGMVAVMEEARAVAALTKTGWRPRRTIVYAAWDAEEPGLIGSSEWAETHAPALTEKAVIYVNSDSNRRGTLHAEGSHTLEQLVNEVAREVMDPDKRVTVAERLQARRLVGGSGQNSDAKRQARQSDSMRIDALGSGSDYTAFIHHLGVASLNLDFGRDSGGGSYHSIYDSFDHYTRFDDHNLEYGLVLARTAGRVMLRIADADVLPFEFKRFAETVGRYVKEVEKLTDDTRERTEEENRLVRDGTLAVAAPTLGTFVPPKPKPPVPRLDFAPLREAAAVVAERADTFDRAYDGWWRSGQPLTPDAAAGLNHALMHSERALIRADGLPLRPWFKHQIYAPGLYTGYAVKTLPGVREAIEQHDWKLAEQQIGRLGETLRRFAGEIERAIGFLPAVTQQGEAPTSRLFNGKHLTGFHTYLARHATKKRSAATAIHSTCSGSWTARSASLGGSCH